MKDYLNELFASTINGVLAFEVDVSPPKSYFPRHDVGNLIGKVWLQLNKIDEIEYTLTRSCYDNRHMVEAMVALLPYQWEITVQRFAVEVDSRKHGTYSMNVL